MRTRRRPELRRACLALCAALVVLAAVATAGAADGDEAAAGAAGWEGLLGDRPEPRLGDRWIVVLRGPSLADRVRQAGGTADETRLKRWSKGIAARQERMLARLALHGAPLVPEQRYTRTFNGFAASIEPNALAVLDRDDDVAGVYPVRAAYPARLTAAGEESEALPVSGLRPELGLPGFDGTGVTVALLDTGVDLQHPYLRGRLLPGLDVLDPGSDARAQQNPTLSGRPERHGTELAGLVAGSDGPGGLHGVAPGASILPIRIAGWQPDAQGGVATYARTDQLLAGLELAVDPNADGDTLDAARVALIGLVEPFASFADGAVGRAVDGAAALGTLVVAPAGNDGPAGPTYGSVGAPGGVPGALGVAAADERRSSPMVHVLLTAGLDVLLAGEQPLGGAAVTQGVSAPVVALARPPAAAVGGEGGIELLFDRHGYSRVAGAAVLLPPRTTSPESVREVAAAGARAVLVDGPIPAGALGIDQPVEIPVVGLASHTAADVRAALAGGAPVRFAAGAGSLEENAATGIAPFSSEGLALGGALKPEVAAAGVGLATSEPGRGEDGTARYGAVSGSSAAAALAAGAAALVAQARPELDASSLRQALAVSATPVAGADVVGMVDPAAAATAELVVDPPAVGLGVVLAAGQRVGGTVTLRNLSRRPLDIVVDPRKPAATGVAVTASPRRLRLRPGRTREVAVSVRVATRPQPPSALRGTLVLRVRNGRWLRVPWAVAVPATRASVVSELVLSRRAFAPSDTEPAVLAFVAGRVDGTRDRPQLRALSELDVDLWRRGRRIGTLARMRDVLPGRYAFGLTGRGPRGKRLPRGAYEIRVTGTPVDGGPASESRVRFRIT
jgi:subtilisin family serine protease